MLTKTGEITLSCLTPYLTLKTKEMVEPQHTENNCVEYLRYKIITIVTGRPFYNSFLNSDQWLTLSNAFDASRNHRYMRLDNDLWYSIMCLREKIQLSVPNPLLKPNNFGDVTRRCSYVFRINISKIVL